MLSNNIFKRPRKMAVVTLASTAALEQLKDKLPTTAAWDAGTVRIQIQNLEATDLYIGWVDADTDAARDILAAAQFDAVAKMGIIPQNQIMIFEYESSDLDGLYVWGGSDSHKVAIWQEGIGL